MRLRVEAIAAASLLLAPGTLASLPPPDPAGPIYALGGDAAYQSGCFPPCLCPVMLAAPVQGTFRLTPAGSDGEFATFVVSDVDWTVALGPDMLGIHGAGEFKLGGDPKRAQQLVLDLSIAGDPPQRFDSGVVPADAGSPHFIDATVSKNGMYCFDTAIAIVAAPVVPARVPALRPGASLALAALLAVAGVGLSRRAAASARRGSLSR